MYLSVDKLRNICAFKRSSKLLGNIFASWEANFVSATVFSVVGKQGNIDRKHNVWPTMFPSLQGLCAVYYTSLLNCLLGQSILFLN